MLEKIEEDRQRLRLEKTSEGPSETRGEEDDDAVLVACKDEYMCLQLQDVVRHGPQKVNLAPSSFLFPITSHVVNFC